MDKYQVMVVDINNNCNIRCIFCFNDWSQPRKTVYMDSETFSKVLELLPLVGRCFFSCAYEPTMHPKWIEFFRRVPKTEAYTFVTTNLARRLTDKEVVAMAGFNLDSITISLGSFVPEIYEELHKGAKFDKFIDNLERIVFIFKRNPNAPKLRFITVVFKQNLDELEHIAEVCNKKYLSTMNQFRTAFLYTPKLKDTEWAKKSMVSKVEYGTAVNRLKKLPYNILFFDPFYKSCTDVPIDGTVSIAGRSTNTYFSFRANGEIYFHEKDKERLPAEFRKSFNINDIDKPYEFFKLGLQKI